MQLDLQYNILQMHKPFSPLALNSDKIVLNRLAVAPMTTQQSEADGSLSSAEAAWLYRLARDGYGIVLSCAASISDTATAFHGQLSLAHDRFIPELSKLATVMKNEGSLNVIQLCHAGSRALEILTGEKAHSASSYQLPIPDFEAPRTLSLEQIQGIIGDFAAASVRAEKAGFDGVELHGANGYLFTQFFSTMTNLRSDTYGGNLENRARFAREVVRACRARVSKNFLIGFRISFEGMGMETGLDIDENVQIANWLAEDGIDYIHSSQMHYAAKSVKYPESTLAEYVKQRLADGLLLMIPGSVWSADDVVGAMNLGADLVAIGRAAIGNKNVPEYFQKGEDLPHRTPFSVDTLREIGISEAFIDYLENAPPLRSLQIVAH